MGWKPAPPFIAFSIFIFRTDIKLPEREVLCRGKILGEADAFPLGVLAARGCLGVPQDPPGHGGCLLLPWHHSAPHRAAVLLARHLGRSPLPSAEGSN